MPLWQRKENRAPAAPDEPFVGRIWSPEYDAIVEEVNGLSHDELVVYSAALRRQVEDCPWDERLVLRADLAQDRLNHLATSHASAGWEPRVPTPFAG
jgi:hypothetical protein